MPFKIYHKELEKVPEFRGFNDFIATFPLYRGKTKSKDDEDDDGTVGEFKVMDINFCMVFCQALISCKKSVLVRPFGVLPRGRRDSPLY